MHACAAGAYMEWTKANRLVLGTSLLPCNATEDFPVACYRFRWQSLSRRYSLFDATKLCNNRTHGRFHRMGCMHGLGYAYSLGYFARTGKLLPISLVCSVGNVEERSMCVFGYWWGIPHSDNSTLREQVCQPLLGSDSIIMQACLHGSGSALRENTTLFYSTSESIRQPQLEMYKHNSNRSVSNANPR